MQFSIPFWKKSGARTRGSRKRPPKRKPSVGLQPRPQRRHHYFIATLMGFLVWVVSTLSILHQRQLTTPSLVVGQIAPADVYSEVPFSHVDMKATERLREEARQAVSPVFQVDSRRSQEALKLLDAILAQIAGTGETQPVRSTAFDEAVRNTVQGFRERGLFDPLAQAIDRVGASRIREWVARQLSRGIVTDRREDTFFANMGEDDRIVVVDRASRRMERRVDAQLNRFQAAEAVKAAFAESVQQSGLDQRQAVEALALEVLRPNLVFSAGETATDREEAASKVARKSVLIDRDVLLLKRGTRVSADALRLLQDHLEELKQYRRERHLWREAVFYSGLCLFLLIALGYILYVVEPHVLLRTSEVVSLASLLLFQMVFTRVFTDIYFIHFSSDLSYTSVVPLAAGAMLMSQLLGLRVTVAAIIYTSLIAAGQSDDSLQLFFVSIFSCLVGAMLFRRARKRSHSMQAAAGVAVAVVVVQLLFLIKEQISLARADEVALLAILNGFLVTAVAFVLLPFLEFLFGVTTDISLLELSDLNHPLLKRLQMEAPGTYHHSLMVATLAEQAAAAIGANPLLARVCAYFHDIGKLSQPVYFTENVSFGGQTPHDGLQPRMSSLVILNHVREGLALAEKHKLRKVIREGISQHHGTSLISFFYHRAREKNGGENGDRDVDAKDYRYPGPTPMRKEIVLLSIADSCEAATRSLEKPTPQKIGNLVDEIVGKKIADGQLDLADLSFRELAIAKRAIVKTLTNMHHGRVAYPKDEKEEATDERSAQEADSENSPEGSTEAAENDSTGSS